MRYIVMGCCFLIKLRQIYVVQVSPTSGQSHRRHQLWHNNNTRAGPRIEMARKDFEEGHLHVTKLLIVFLR